MYFRSRNCVCTGYAHQGGGGGGNSVCMTDGGVCIFLTFASPSHLNQLFCNLHDL